MRIESGLPEVRVLFKAALKVEEPLLERRHRHKCICAWRHLRLCDGERRHVVEATLEHLGAELSIRVNGDDARVKRRRLLGEELQRFNANANLHHVRLVVLDPAEWMCGIKRRRV